MNFFLKVLFHSTLRLRFLRLIVTGFYELRFRATKQAGVVLRVVTIQLVLNDPRVQKWN